MGNKPSDRYYGLGIETRAVGFHHDEDKDIQLSQAISLKRIADSLEQLSATLHNWSNLNR